MVRKKKVFKADEGPRGELEWCGEYASLDDVKALLDYNWPENFRREITKLLQMPPVVRLRYNLNKLMEMMSEHQIQSVIQDGLTQLEYDMLYLGATMSSDAQRALHTLLNIHERDRFFHFGSVMFQTYRTRRNSYDDKE